MVTVLLLGVSILFQLIAAGMALWFIKATQRRIGWVLMAAAILLMAVRRSITLFYAVQSDGGVEPEFYAEGVALLISVLMCAGVYQIGGLFRETRENRSRLRESESRYRSLYDEVSDGIILADVKGGRLEPNPSAIRMFGYSSEEFSALHATRLFVPQDLKEDPVEFASLREGKKLLKTRRLVRKDGTIFFAEISSTLLATGQFVALIRDITSRHDSERVLQANEAHLRAVLNSVFDAIVTVDLEGGIIECNRGTCSMFREKRERLIGAQVVDFIPELQERWDQIASVSELPKEALRWELEAMDRHGRSFPVEVSVTSVELEDETRLMVAVRDLTKWRELQAHVVQTQKMEALGTLAGGVAHDFNNVLMVLLGSLEMALEDVGADHPSRSGLERAFSAARRGRDLVNQILTFSRKEPFEMSGVDMNVMFNEALELLRPMLPVSVELQCECEPNLPIVMGDKTQLQQVFLNLVTNAFQSYEGENGKVFCHCGVTDLGSGDDDRFDGVAPGLYVVLTVQDFGAGIPSAVRDRIFDPFFTTKTADEGTGMGLSVVLGIIEQHGGGIEVVSEEGEGSTFLVRLPLASDTELAPAVLPPALVEGKGRMIVLVDDQEAVLLMAKRLLERIGFSCEAFPDVEGALAFLSGNSTPVSVLFTDLAMPNQNGLALARQIRKRGLKVPIVLTTGNPSGLGEKELAESGVTQLLAKPYGLHELSACLAEILDEAS